MNENSQNDVGSQSKQMATLLFIHALTSMHPGSGTALGTVDLPVQRERHTQWPIIPGSTLKGILRDACRPPNNGKDEWLAAFGPESNSSDEHASALSLTDARILAFPVRSLKGVFAWVTCQAVLERLIRDLTLLQINELSIPNTWPKSDQAFCQGNSPLLLDGNKLILEEFEFERTDCAEGVDNWISKHAISDGDTQKRLQNHLVILHNDDFTHFVRHATEVVARVALNSDTKTAQSGALFYEEFLPPETLFYSVVLANASRKDGFSKNPSEILGYLRSKIPSVLQIGANETIGKGICVVTLCNGKAGA